MTKRKERERMFYEREKNKECFIKERRHKRKRKERKTQITRNKHSKQDTTIQT